MKLMAGIGSFPRCVGSQELGHIGLRAARLVRVVQPTGFITHQAGGLYIDVRAGDGKLHALVLADGAVKDNALLGVGRYLVDEPVAVAYALGRDQRAFGIQARSEEHTSELQSLMRISYAVFCLKKK